MSEELKCPLFWHPWLCHWFYGMRCEDFQCSEVLLSALSCLLILYLRFWNQILTWADVNPTSAASCFLSLCPSSSCGVRTPASALWPALNWRRYDAWQQPKDRRIGHGWRGCSGFEVSLNSPETSGETFQVASFEHKKLQKINVSAVEV